MFPDFADVMELIGFKVHRGEICDDSYLFLNKT